MSMYQKNDKRRLYQLMDMFLERAISASVFCDEFYYCYDLEVDYATLTSLEYSTFSGLDIVSSRFSEFEKDHIQYPKGFYTEEELRNKILETKEKLCNKSS